MYFENGRILKVILFEKCKNCLAVCKVVGSCSHYFSGAIMSISIVLCFAKNKSTVEISEKIKRICNRRSAYFLHKYGHEGI